MKTIYIFLFIAMFSPCFGQKSEQVKNYLGESRYISNAPDSGRVVFHFQKGQLKRFTDGLKTFSQILPDAPGYSDADNAGKLLSVTVNGVRIAPLQKAAEAGVPHSEIRSLESLPDSISFADQAEELKRRATFWEGQMWGMIRPIWSVVMHFFWIVFPLILIACVVCWVWAKTAASEQFPTIHYAASRSLTMLILTTWTFFIISACLTIVGMEMGPFGMIFCAAICGLVAYKSAAWIIPNFRHKPNERPQYSNPNNQRQLN